MNSYFYSSRYQDNLKRQQDSGLSKEEYADLVLKDELKKRDMINTQLDQSTLALMKYLEIDSPFMTISRCFNWNDPNVLRSLNVTGKYCLDYHFFEPTIDTKLIGCFGWLRHNKSKFSLNRGGVLCRARLAKSQPITLAGISDHYEWSNGGFEKLYHDMITNPLEYINTIDIISHSVGGFAYHVINKTSIFEKFKQETPNDVNIYQGMIWIGTFDIVVPFDIDRVE